MSKDTFFTTELGIGIPCLEDLKGFFETYCIDEIYELLNNYPDKRNICIDLTNVQKFSRGLEQALISKYEDTTEILKTALLETDSIRSDTREYTEKSIDLQFYNMPKELRKSIRTIDSSDLGNLICVDGFVKARSTPKLKTTVAAFKCLRCDHITLVEEDDTKLEEPFFCENRTCEKKGPFKLLLKESKRIDFQLVKLQELPDSMKGTKPYDILVYLEGSLTKKLEAGERVTIIGVLDAKQTGNQINKSCLFDYILKGVSIEKQNTDFEDYILTEADKEEVLKLSENPEIREMVCNSIAPSIHGYKDIKRALALQLFSGVRKILPDGTVLRGRINIAIIGDPSTAKSQMIRKTVTLSPRGIFTSGKTSSAVGLTAGITKDEFNGEFAIVGGGAVIASGGILGIDEIGHARAEDKSALHEVMEQGTVTISKAGILATLKADSSILAAGNPKDGYFNKYEPYAKQINIEPALWSRFDMIFTIFDKADSKKDEAVADHVLRNHRIGGITQNRENALNTCFSDEDLQQEEESIKAPISAELLKKYIAYAKTYIFPVASKEVSDSMKELYLAFRNMNINDPDKPVPVTIRSLEAIQRLSEASARMRLSNVVEEKDVKFARELIMQSLKDIGYDEEGTLDACLLLGLDSSSVITNVKRIRTYADGNSTEEDIISIMEEKHKINPEKSKSLIKRLMTEGKLYLRPSGALAVPSN